VRLRNLRIRYNHNFSQIAPSKLLSGGLQAISDSYSQAPCPWLSQSLRLSARQTIDSSCLQELVLPTTYLLT